MALTRHIRTLSLSSIQKPASSCFLYRSSINTIQRHHQSTQLEVKQLSWQREATLYVHWPFCQRRCTYCNFNKYIDRDTDHERMRKCLVTETRTLLKLSGVKRIRSIFFGGGTPSLALPSTLHDVIDTVAGLTELDNNAEITMEANPTSIETSKMKNFKSAGINRISLGIQALNNNDLKVLGRDHSAEESVQSIKEAMRLFPGHVSVDLIFGRPGQTLMSWQQELRDMLQICNNHLSLYQLTLERGTALFKMNEQGKLSMPDSDLMAEMYEDGVDMLQGAGLVRYEVSNFAREGAESEHNKSYWNGDQYIGIGPGAHGRFIPQNMDQCDYLDSLRPPLSHPQREARIQTLEPDPWMWEVEHRGHGTRKRTPQTQKDILEEFLMLGLRTRQGILGSRWKEFATGSTLEDVFRDSDVVNTFVEEGLFEMDVVGMRVSKKGMSVLDSILPELLNVLSSYYHDKRDNTLV